MGDDIGLYFGTCDKWSIQSNAQSMKICEGNITRAQKIALGVCLPVGAIIVVTLAIWADRKFLKKRKEEYEGLNK
jgi:hypothetical protein